MDCRLGRFLPDLMAIAIVIVSLNGTPYAQVTTVTVNVPNASPTPVLAPITTQFFVSATVSPAPQKVEFYRNDVLIGTVSSGTLQVAQNNLGQDTYTYRVRAFASNGDYQESSEDRKSTRLNSSH